VLEKIDDVRQSRFGAREEGEHLGWWAPHRPHVDNIAGLRQHRQLGGSRSSISTKASVGRVRPSSTAAVASPLVGGAAVAIDNATCSLLFAQPHFRVILPRFVWLMSGICLACVSLSCLALGRNRLNVWLVVGVHLF
jgi:hypothetical protein